MKKIFVLVLSLCLSFGLITTNVHASTNEINNMLSELENYIQSGSGTEDDPYVIDESYPYKNYLDAQVLAIFNNPNSNINLLADFSGALSVLYNNNNYYNGGRWYATGNTPDVNSDGNCWIRNISYGGRTYLNDFKTLRLNATNWNTFGQKAVQNGGEELVNQLLTAGIGLSSATAAGIMVAYKVTIQAINAYTLNMINTAINNNYGLLTINYSTSYHGSWYVTSTATYWTTYPKVYVPASFYGTGIFQSK